MYYGYWLRYFFIFSSLAITCFSSSHSTALTKELTQQNNVQPANTLVNRSLAVSKYRSASMNNNEADRIFRDATNILRRNDGSGDVSCDITFNRSGNVSSFTTGDGSIDSSGEFNAVLRSSGYVKVVNRINWCGRYAPNIIGCAPVPGNGMVVVRYSRGLEGILWAHEYGHTAGLSHRNSSTAVMNGTISSNRRRVSSSECSSFKR